MPSGTRVQALRDQILVWREELQELGSRLVIARGKNPLPWRLTKQAVARVDDRVMAIVYPHGPSGCSDNKSGFFRNFSCISRSSQKILALLVIMPTVLRDYVPHFRGGMRSFVWGMRLLQGRCLSAAECVAQKMTIGSRPLGKKDIDSAELLIAEGMSKFAGANILSYNSVYVCLSHVTHTVCHTLSQVHPILIQCHLAATVLTTIRIRHVFSVCLRACG